MDQNEKMLGQKWQIKVLGVLDGYTRLMMSWSVVTRLDGHAHNNVFVGAMKFLGGAPQRISIDGDIRWNCVRHLMNNIIYSDSRVTVLEVGDGDFIGVPRVMVGSSKHNPLSEYRCTIRSP